jgi:hypothetical protein
MANTKHPKRLGVCKHCFCAVGRDSLGHLVHVRNLKIHCNGVETAPKAELR